MAVFDKQSRLIDVLGSGMTTNDANKGLSFIQNLEQRQSSWSVRSGFGVVAQLDSTLMTGKNVLSGSEIGPNRHLGSHLVRQTSFGHKQILSVFREDAYTSDFLNGASQKESRVNQYRTLYMVSIYDLTTDEKWVMPLHQHTSKDGTPLWRRHGTFETAQSTRMERDYQSWVDAGQSEVGTNREFNTDKDEFFYFVEHQNRIYFGNERAGAWIYNPADFRSADKTYRQRRMSVNGADVQDWRNWYSESTCIQPLNVHDGIFSTDGVVYFTQTEFGKPQAACALGRRIVWAVDNSLLFSDPEDVNAITDVNVQTFEKKIVAVAPSLGNLIVWTEDNKTYLYNPAQGDIISGGRVTEMSSHVGCLGPNAWTLVNGAVVWIDKTGIWRNHGNVTVQKLSEPIDEFFQTGVSNAISEYYVQTGISSGSIPQPTTFYDWTDASQVGINVTYQPTQNQIIFNIPSLKFSWIIENGGYHLWNYETVVAMSGSTPLVQGINNMPKPWLMADIDDIYAVAGPVIQNMQDSTTVGGFTETDVTRPTAANITATNYNTPSKSYLVLHKGRGGALDRSSVDQEDIRLLTGEYIDNGTNSHTAASNPRDNGFFYIEKPIKVPGGTSFSWAGSSIDADDATAMYVPIKLVPQYIDMAIEPSGSVVGVKEIYCEFKFDNIMWEPIANANAAQPYEVTFDLPPERLAGRGAYFLDTANNELSKGVWAFSRADVIGSINGDTIKMHVHAISGSFTTADTFGIVPRHKNPLIKIPFRRRTDIDISDYDSYSLGVDFFDGYTINTLGTKTHLPMRVWNDQSRTVVTKQPQVAPQAVDWAFTANEIDSESIMMKARGVDVRVENSGNATLKSGDPGVAGWPTRIFNAVFSTDYKQYAAQLIDHTNVPAGTLRINKNAIRNRMGTSATQTTPTFSNTSSAQGAVWGDHSDPSAGNFLIGDAPYDEIKTSVGLKGNKIVVQLMGHILSSAEKLRIGTAKLLVRMLPGFRRKGR